MPETSKLDRQIAQALGGPPQRRHRIAACRRLHQGSEIAEQIGSASTRAGRPAPFRRTRPGAASGSASPRSSESPRPIVLRAMPVIRETAIIPPRPPPALPRRQTDVARARPAQDRAPNTVT